MRFVPLPSSFPPPERRSSITNSSRSILFLRRRRRRRPCPGRAHCCSFRIRTLALFESLRRLLAFFEKNGGEETSSKAIFLPTTENKRNGRRLVSLPSKVPQCPSTIQPSSVSPLRPVRTQKPSSRGILRSSIPVHAVTQMYYWDWLRRRRVRLPQDTVVSSAGTCSTESLCSTETVVTVFGTKRTHKSNQANSLEHKLLVVEIHTSSPERSIYANEYE